MCKLLSMRLRKPLYSRSSFIGFGGVLRFVCLFVTYVCCLLVTYCVLWFFLVLPHLLAHCIVDGTKFPPVL